VLHGQPLLQNLVRARSDAESSEYQGHQRDDEQTFGNPSRGRSPQHEGRANRDRQRPGHRLSETPRCRCSAQPWEAARVSMPSTTKAPMILG
jgi:hypothetical protein